MKRSAGKILFGTNIGRMFLIFWIGSAALITARIVFEVKTVLRGSTIICRGKSYDYIFHVPPGFQQAGYRYPLLIYLHGAGERNRSIHRLSRADLVSYADHVARSSDFPFLVVCPKTDRPFWEPDRVIALLDELLSNEQLRWKIDPNRVYLTGYSMGGFGTFSVASEYPDRFAAIVPVAGGGDPLKADHFARLPVWSFHGELDEAVLCECSVKMLEALWSRFPDHTEDYRLTVYPDADHGIPKQVYGDPALYRWLLRHRREAGPIPSP